ncbi:MAG: hypothetical protein WA981_03805 [Glaciecola sp.]
MRKVTTVAIKVHGESELIDKLFKSFRSGEIVDNVEVYAVSLEDEIARVERFESEDES